MQGNKHVTTTRRAAMRSGLPAISVNIWIAAEGRLFPAAFLARMEMVNILSSSNPVRVKDLADPATVTIALPSSPGQSMTSKLYEIKKESTTSPGGCVQVRSMVVLVSEEDCRLVGVEGTMTGEWISAKAVHIYYSNHACHLPMHVTPSPVYPWLQVQVKPPGVLVQAALVLQLSASVTHSLISDKMKTINCNKSCI